MKRISIIAAIAMMVLPSVSHAAMYEYVDKGGRLQVVEAASAEEALMLSDPFVYDSGVKLGTELYAASLQAADEEEDTGSAEEHEYRYVSTSGTLKTITASSPSEAMANAPDRMPNSGVQLVE